MVWTGSIWLRIGASGGLLWTRWWNFGFHKMLGSSLVHNWQLLKKGSAPLVSTMQETIFLMMGMVSQQHTPYSYSHWKTIPQQPHMVWPMSSLYGNLTGIRKQQIVKVNLFKLLTQSKIWRGLSLNACICYMTTHVRNALTSCYSLCT
jgi:hypothetical protein